jgi:hypothetical protein
VYFNARTWTSEQNEDARQIQRRAEIFLEPTVYRSRDREFPVNGDHEDDSDD